MKRGLLLCAASLAALSAVGCASQADDQSVDGAGEAAEAQALQAPSSQTTVKDPNGAYFADVTANGTGCPAGTWTTSLSPDGQTFTTTFSAFEAEVDRSRAISIKDCNLSIKIHSPQGLSYTVEDFYYGGYLYLEPGVSARQQSNYYFQGSPDEGAEIVTDIEGPQDKSFLVQDTRENVNFVRSRCGEEQTLNVRATLRLRNSNPRGNGYINVAAIDGSTKLVLKLSWKRCNQ
ncbi:MAG: DUF4360 domain-containing protein [Polyangiales bacterium]